MNTNINVSSGLFEALLRQAVIDNYEEELAMISAEVELSNLHSFSNRHIEGINRLFDQAKKRERLKAAAKWARRSVAVFIVGTMVLFGALMTVPQVRATVATVIIEWVEQFTKFTSSQDSSQGFQEWEPAYVPEGFIEDERYGDFGRLTIWYSDFEGSAISFTYIKQGDSISVDNEGRDFFEIEAAGITYCIFESKDLNKGTSIIWDNYGYRFSIEGQSPVSELLKIAKSVEKIF